MSQAVSAYTVEERLIQGETLWVAIRARGAEWSWLTPAEAAHLGRQWVEKYGNSEHGGAAEPSDRNTLPASSPELVAAE